MAEYINNELAFDKYTDAFELGPMWDAKSAAITVSANPAKMQFATGSGPGHWRWIDEREWDAPAGPNIINAFRVSNILGVRFRNAIAGQRAQIICTLSSDSGDDPVFESGLLSAGSIANNGSVTPPSIVGLLDTVRFPLSGVQAIPNGAVTNVLWSNLVDWDSNVATFPSIGAPTTQLKVGVTGVYRVGVMIEWAVNAAGSRLVRPLSSGGADERIGSWVAANPVQPTQQTFSGECQIGTGDFITIGVFQDSGGALNVIDGWVSLDRIA